MGFEFKRWVLGTLYCHQRVWLQRRVRRIVRRQPPGRGVEAPGWVPGRHLWSHPACGQRIRKGLKGVVLSCQGQVILPGNCPTQHLLATSWPVGLMVASGQPGLLFKCPLGVGLGGMAQCGGPAASSGHSRCPLTTPVSPVPLLLFPRGQDSWHSVFLLSVISRLVPC